MSYRASSVAPTLSRDPFDRAMATQRVRRIADPLPFTYKGDEQFASSYSVRSVSHSVTGRAAQAAPGGMMPNRVPVNGNGMDHDIPPGARLLPASRFMSLEEECNWILSGREPIMDNGWDDEDDEDNTLDDISGDEVWGFIRLILISLLTV